MLHILDHAADWREDDRLCRMFAARKRVFIDLLKWQVPVVDDCYERDQFDAPGATYLVLTDPSGAHLASARLLPTMRPHILGDLYPHLCETPPPFGPTVYEITRFCLDRRLRAPARREARNRLVSAIAEFGVWRGVTTYTGVAEIGWLQQILAFGWRCRPLGLPVAERGAMLCALAIEIDAATPARLRDAGIYRPVLVDPVDTGERRHAA
ncbi:autoinducer synthase [Sphingomonas cannabina]|uniref:acyl-homoserine-lactone synthase n=1 Tax=Sphingomonas cannabina TaxID=2899123 RepID=UPI001F47BBBA|nr:acyl-homoserine-lactone synthase [Sphingomonas cannabina]UIJ44790.1 autoinducer synthase [Sphingomonas cannabina]